MVLLLPAMAVAAVCLGPGLEAHARALTTRGVRSAGPERKKSPAGSRPTTDFPQFVPAVLVAPASKPGSSDSPQTGAFTELTIGACWLLLPIESALQLAAPMIRGAFPPTYHALAPPIL